MRALALVLLVAPTWAPARTSGDPIRLVWDEGDVAGMSTIRDETGGTVIGSIEYHQVRRGDVLTTFWVLPGEPPALARFAGPRNYAREAIRIQ